MAASLLKSNFFQATLSKLKCDMETKIEEGDEHRIYNMYKQNKWHK